jgi:heme exporter protein B
VTPPAGVPRAGVAPLLLMLLKDLRVEWRTREITISMGLLTLLLVIILGASRSDATFAPVAMWITYAFAAAVSLGRTFAPERDHLAALRLAPLDRGLIFASKALVNWIVVTVVQVVSIPVFGALFTETIWTRLPALVLPLVLGGAGLAAAGTLYGGLLAQARLREALLPILMLPVALPVLIAAVSATAAILDGQPVAAVRSHLQLLGTFDVLFAASSVFLFDALLDE